ncbi:MAG: hypothetical protein R3286_00650 [Gammaproteobacteria bacterium]|nr:hypothetical protein [Gammaproteobacteria bacterium]
MNATRLGLAAVMILVLPAVAAADFQAGLAAYERGDLAAAEREFAALAELGDAPAQYNLAMLYLKRTPPDYRSARPWLRRAAEGGVAGAQYMLGVLAYHGVGARRDEQAALTWLERASAQGDADAQALIEEIRAARSREAEALAEEQARAREAKAKAEREARVREDQARKAEARKAEARKAEALAEAQARAREQEQARLAAELEGLRKQLAEARRAEKSLESKLARAERRIDSLVSERDTLRNASATQTRTVTELGRERAALEGRLAELEAKLEALPRAATVAGPALGETLAEQVVTGTIVDVVDDGILLAEVSTRLAGESQATSEKGIVFVHLTATNGIVTGRKIEFLAEPAEPHAYRADDGDVRHIPAYRVLGERSRL